ncbi:MAG: TPM domain-containing protein, partial [Flavobacteriaceae bacterium]|nr:TPM domain-containing protein [Flavobacteriaceae bacterium]
MHYQLKYLTLLVAFFFISINCFSQEIPKKPDFIPPIIDSTNTLSSNQKQALYDKLRNYSDTTSTEILVIIQKSTYGEDIAMYSTELGHKWEIGKRGKENGVVFLITIDDHKLWIASGYGVEHLLTDAMSKRIVEEIIIPSFKKGNFYEGIDNGTTAIMQVLSGEFKGVPSTKSEGIPVIFIIILFIILLIILSNR